MPGCRRPAPRWFCLFCYKRDGRRYSGVFSGDGLFNDNTLLLVPFLRGKRQPGSVQGADLITAENMRVYHGDIAESDQPFGIFLNF